MEKYMKKIQRLLFILTLLVGTLGCQVVDDLTDSDAVSASDAGADPNGSSSGGGAQADPNVIVKANFSNYSDGTHLASDTADWEQ
jgi:hypothetical protein